MDLKWKRSDLKAPFPKLCDRCSPIFSTLEGLQAVAKEKGRKHCDFVELVESADRGCSFCSLMLQSLDVPGAASLKSDRSAFIIIEGGDIARNVQDLHGLFRFYGIQCSICRSYTDRIKGDIITSNVPEGKPAFLIILSHKI
jgi:hypothetical protein